MRVQISIIALMLALPPSIVSAGVSDQRFVNYTVHSPSVSADETIQFTSGSIYQDQSLSNGIEAVRLLDRKSYLIVYKDNDSKWLVETDQDKMAVLTLKYGPNKIQIGEKGIKIFGVAYPEKQYVVILSK